MFIDTLKFNLSECVEFLFLTSIDSASETANMEVFRNLFPYTCVWVCFNWDFPATGQYAGTAKPQHVASS